MITYNHEKYIAEAIEGVLMQEVDFEVELVIADDASTDRTGEVIQSYIDSHSRGYWIKYTRQPVNKGMMGNFIWALESCNGKYIALCEGDDFWTDSFKLQNQVAFLETHSNVVLSYHSVNILMPDGILKADFIAENNFKSDVSGLYDLALFGNYIHTPSVVFKNVIQKYPDYFNELKVGDFFLYLILAEKGSFSRLPLKSAVYRFGVGSFSGLEHKRMRKSFKQSILLASKNQKNKIVSILLWLRFHQNDLYHSKKIVNKGNPGNKLGQLWSFVSIVQVFKGIIKFVLKTEFKELNILLYKL